MAEAVKVEGLTTFRATMSVAARKVGNMAPPAKETATFLGTRGRADAPRRTGRLSSSVRGTTNGDDVDVVSALPYANRVHWGYAAVGQRAQPWLVEGRDNTESTWLRNYETYVEKSLDMVRGV